MVFSESTVKSILGLLKAYLPFMVGVVENAIKDQNRKLTGDVVEGVRLSVIFAFFQFLPLNISLTKIL